MTKILITGGSGFIGTNLIEHFLLNQNIELLSINIEKPKISAHNRIWKQINICDKESVVSIFRAFQPEIVIHLAARTDLRGATLQDYDANMSGVSNVLAAISGAGSVQRAVFASSMYVCEPGYMPKDFEDYAPHTLYGESKVETEKRIRKANPTTYTWSIIRPTSIWGPWFGEPYDKFFHIVLKHMYFHMGEKACKKTYGYIDNAIYQIESILRASPEKVNRNIYYLGDYEAYSITDWANEIANIEGIKIPHVPYFCFRWLGYVGDCLKKIGIAFPMTSFRLHNMTTDNVHNLEPIKSIAPHLPVSRVEGTKVTLDWIHKYE